MGAHLTTFSDWVLKQERTQQFSFAIGVLGICSFVLKRAFLNTPPNLQLTQNPQLPPLDLSWLQAGPPTSPKPANIRRVLTIDGGGMRGLVSITILKKLEKDTGKKVYELFDFIAGTSTGAIIAALSGLLRLSMVDIERLYLELGKRVFGKTADQTFRRFIFDFSFYDTQEMVDWFKLILKQLGISDDIKMNDPRFANGPKVMFVASNKSLSPPTLYLIRNYPSPATRYGPLENDKGLIYGLMGSACAPSYFSPLKSSNILETTLIDGGILANNPTQVVVHELDDVFKVSVSKLQCLWSVGTGRSPQTAYPTYWIEKYLPEVCGVLIHGSKLFSDLAKITTNTQEVANDMDRSCPAKIYYRVDPFVQDLDLATTEPEPLRYLLGVTETWILKDLHRSFTKRIQTNFS